jgi:4-hydroxy-3-methylbut-2-enyl diphosphate reductase IspH
MTVMLANPRGFCAGVDRAIDIVNRALESSGNLCMFVTRSFTTKRLSTI